MNKIKKYFIVTMVSVGIGTTLSTLIYLLFGRGSFNLLQPFSVQLENPIYNATIGILIYCAFGSAVFSAYELFQDFENRKIYHVFGSYFMNVAVFSILAILSLYPLGQPVNLVWSIYFNELGPNSFLLHFVMFPVIECVVIYFVVYVVLWLSYLRQVRRLNKLVKIKNLKV